MIYTLQKDISVSVDTAGGELVSLKTADGVQYLWQGDPKYWSGRAPLLFPIVGCLQNGEAALENGLSCRMPRHGLVRKMEFTLKSQTDDSITLAVSADDSTKQSYPFDFTAEVTYTLKGASVETKFTVHNNGDDAMPCQFGGHPAFNCPNENGLDFKDYFVEFQCEETADVPLINGDGIIDVNNRMPVIKNSRILPLDHSLFYKDALVFDALRSRSVSLKSNKTDRFVTVSFDGLDYLGIWSAVNDAPFVALEPWGGISSCTDEGGRFTDKRGVRVVPPHGATEYSFTITIG